MKALFRMQAKGRASVKSHFLVRSDVIGDFPPPRFFVYHVVIEPGSAGTTNLMHVGCCQFMRIHEGS